MSAPVLSGSSVLSGLRVPAQLPVNDWLLHDHRALRDQASAALDRRRTAYPALVEKQAMTPADAASDIAAWELLAGEWDWICAGPGTANRAPPPSWTIAARIEAVQLALERTGNALRAAPRDADLQHQCDLYRAMLCHLSLHDSGCQRSHHFARLNHLLRARACGAEQVLCATCERRADDPATIGCTSADCGLKHKEAA